MHFILSIPRPVSVCVSCLPLVAIVTAQFKKFFKALFADASTVWAPFEPPHHHRLCFINMSFLFSLQLQRWFFVVCFVIHLLCIYFWMKVFFSIFIINHKPHFIFLHALYVVGVFVFCFDSYSHASDRVRYVIDAHRSSNEFINSLRLDDDRTVYRMTAKWTYSFVGKFWTMPTAGRRDGWSGCGASERCHSIELNLCKSSEHTNWIKLQLNRLFPATNYFRIWFGHEAAHSIFFQFFNFFGWCRLFDGQHHAI